MSTFFGINVSTTLLRPEQMCTSYSMICFNIWLMSSDNQVFVIAYITNVVLPVSDKSDLPHSRHQLEQISLEIDVQCWCHFINRTKQIWVCIARRSRFQYLQVTTKSSGLLLLIELDCSFDCLIVWFDVLYDWLIGRLTEWLTNYLQGLVIDPMSDPTMRTSCLCFQNEMR